MASAKNTDPKDSRVFLIGSGIASLASAVYLTKDAGVPGDNIHILEKDAIVGGALDGSGDEDAGFVVRGGRMHEAHYECYWELLSHIPSYDDPAVSVRDESFAFNEKYVSNAQARLLRDGKKLDVSSYGLSLKQQTELLKLTFASEHSLGRRRIEDWFDEAFFETNYWHIWTSMFAFQKWSSLAEMRRYMRRFIHLVDGLNRLGGVMRTKYNQYHSVALPMRNYLVERGVHFDLGMEVVDIDFDLAADTKTATVIHLANGDQIALRANDYVFITNGSLTESTDDGAWDRPAVLKGLADSGSWRLWKKLAAKDPSLLHFFRIFVSVRNS